MHKIAVIWHKLHRCYFARNVGRGAPAVESRRFDDATSFLPESPSILTIFNEYIRCYVALDGFFRPPSISLSLIALARTVPSIRPTDSKTEITRRRNWRSAKSSFR